MKLFLNRGPQPNLMFYRDSNGNQVDLVLPRAQEYIPIEIKSAATATHASMKGLRSFIKVIPDACNPILAYAGEDVRVQEGVRIVNLPELNKTFNDLFPAQH